MKWIIGEGVDFRRGNHTPLVVKFDNSRGWLVPCYSCTTSTARSSFRELGKYYGAKSVEVRTMYDENDRLNFDENGACGYFEDSEEGYKFRIEHKVPEGAKRKFTYFSEDEIFPDQVILNDQEYVNAVSKIAEILAPAIDDNNGIENITAGRAYEEVCHILEEVDPLYDDGYLDNKDIIELKRLKKMGEKKNLKRETVY